MTGAHRPGQGGIVCAGNWIVDLVHDIDHWPQESDLVRIGRQDTGIGGGAANVVTDLCHMGVPFPLTPVGKIGTDQFGDIALAHCEAVGLDPSYLVRVEGTPTAHTHVMNVPGQSRTFFYQGGTNDTLSAVDIPVEALAAGGARLFYLGYLMLLSQLDAINSAGQSNAAAVLQAAREAGMRTCVDLVSADTPDFRAVVEATLPAVDYLFVNEIEAARACGLPAPEPEYWGREQAEICAQKLLNAGVQCAVIVHAPCGALWLGRDGTHQWVEAKPVPREHIVSPVGAGDAFCAGALYAIHENWTAADALALAHRVAAASLSGRTATDGIPRLEDLIPI